MMDLILQHKIIVGLVSLVILVVALLIGEVAFVKLSYQAVPTPNIPRYQQTQGAGPKLSYVILGDSTAVGQGASYADGFAIATAQHLATNHSVSWVNLAVSGARAKDVLTDQVPKAKNYRPDVALVVVGANDVTHLTLLPSFKNSLQKIIDQLAGYNCDVKIVVTGAPQMGSVPRFPQPLQFLAGRRTTRLNQVVAQIVANKKVGFAKIAEATGQTFKQNPSLFAADKFHPNAQGYALWSPVLNQALDDALANQASRCQD